MPTDKLLHLPQDLVEQANASWPRLRLVPEVRALCPRESGQAAVRALLYLALKNLDRLIPEPTAKSDTKK